MEKWRLIRSGPLPGPLNMGLDEALLEAVGAGRSGPVLRLYRWCPPAVTIGYFQPLADINFAACRESGLDVVRRPTGGRAVLHDREATYAVIAPGNAGVFPGGLPDTYRTIARALQSALLSLGVRAELAPGRNRSAQGEESGICFLAPSNWELVCEGRKVAGSSQKRSAGAFLQHGSIPVELNLEQLSRVFDSSGRRTARNGSGQLEKAIGWLDLWLPRPIAVETVEEALVAAFIADLNLQFQEGEPTPDEWRRAHDLAAKKYADPEWLSNPVSFARSEAEGSRCLPEVRNPEPGNKL